MRSTATIVLGILVGVALGLGLYTFVYAKGYSYLTNDPNACADCHMPYTREGGLKISDHDVRSPLLNINRACQTCHRWPEKELKDRVEEIQTRFYDTCNIALDALMDLIHDIKAAKDAGASETDMEQARQYQRQAQLYIDFMISENSMGFHADQYSIKSLAEAIDLCRKGQLALGSRRATLLLSRGLVIVSILETSNRISES
ncbi:MAG: ammonia-forming cytochrome c nitrite reductase subunit c552 [Acidobacteriia bacterium]|nr:ammonia-forming cytochrome c nitrite reductase subunit c552 [Terriglobia bacterium]